jgi:hypothetical protein
VAEAEDPRAQAQLAALARLRVIGMEMAERIGALSAELAGEKTEEALKGCEGLALAFTRVSRAVRQVVALEQEAMGLRDAEERKLRARRNADTAEALRLRVGGLMRERVPNIDRDYLKGLVSDLFRDYDDYDDYEGDDIAPILARICDRFGIDHDPAKWPDTAPALPAGPMTLERAQAIERSLDSRIKAELDRIAERRAAYKAAQIEGNGHDPP